MPVRFIIGNIWSAGRGASRLIWRRRTQPSPGWAPIVDRRTGFQLEVQ